MAVAALPDGRRALSASADKTLKLWDLETGNPLAAFTADSDLFAAAPRRTIASLLSRTMAGSIFTALDVTSRCAPGGALIKQTVGKVGLCGFLCRAWRGRIKHDTHFWIRTFANLVVAGGGVHSPSASFWKSTRRPLTLYRDYAKPSPTLLSRRK